MFRTKQVNLVRLVHSLQDPFFEILLFVLISMITLQLVVRVLNWTHSWV